MDQLIDPEFITEFRKRIVTAFADVPAPNALLINHQCEECLDLQAAFAGRSWRDIPSTLLKDNYSNLSLFSAEAFYAFIPAYLIHSVENWHGEDMVSEFTAYSLLPDKLADKDEGHGNWWKLKLSLFNDEQFALLLEYLDLVERTDEYFDRSLMKRGRERLIILRAAAKNNIQ